MQYSDPYEQWKSEGRPGGDFGSWQQGQALTSGAASTTTEQPAKPTDAPTATTTDWKQQVAAMGVDPGWVVAARQSGLFSPEDYQPEALKDESHRQWMVRQMRKAKEAQPSAAQASAPSVTAAPQATQSGVAAQSTAPTSNQPSKAPPSVLKPGHLPTGPIWQSETVPAGNGWIPSGDGKWWPPWPVTGGPIDKPATSSATVQASALDTMTGQARKEVSG